MRAPTSRTIWLADLDRTSNIHSLRKERECQPAQLKARRATQTEKDATILSHDAALLLLPKRGCRRSARRPPAPIDSSRALSANSKQKYWLTVYCLQQLSRRAASGANRAVLPDYSKYLDHNTRLPVRGYGVTALAQPTLRRAPAGGFQSLVAGQVRSDMLLGQNLGSS